MVLGAELYLVRGNYDAAFALAKQAAAAHGWLCRNTALNPFTVEGKKTVAFEICEALGWDAPDRIYVSVGDGNIITGVHKGLTELLALGWIARMPKLIGVQAEGSAAIANAFRAGTDEVTAVRAKTIADSICADMPADGRRALRAMRDTGGSCVTVSDAEILAALAALGREHAVFAEPAAAAAYAGFVKARHDSGERSVVLITGNGLKDVAAAQQAVARPRVVDPTLSSLDDAMKEA
jgi:threonine synthase